MELLELVDEGLLLGVFTAFGGCSIRYGELYKKGCLNIKFYIVDALTAVFLGSMSYLYMVQTAHIGVLNAAIFNIIIGNFGSRILTFATGVAKQKLTDTIAFWLRNIASSPKTSAKDVSVNNDNEPIDDTKNIS